eukprot:scaffold8499_cov99-Isochrysis_galbana.AAC.2
MKAVSSLTLSVSYELFARGFVKRAYMSGVPPRSSLVALAWARRRRAQSLLRWWLALRLPPRAELRAAMRREHEFKGAQQI